MACKVCGMRHYDGADAAACQERLLQERDEALEAVKHWKQAFRSYAGHADSRCEYFGKCQCGLAALLQEAVE